MYFPLEPEQRHRLSELYGYHPGTKVITPVAQVNNYRITENYESGGAGVYVLVYPSIK